MSADSKTCRVCLITKPVSDFFRHPRMADGHRSNCKSCKYDYDVKNRERFAPRRRAYARKAGLSKEIRAKRCEYYQSRKDDPEFKARLSAIGKRGYKKNAIKRKSAVVLRTAMRSGRVVAAKICEECGSARNIEGHHEDYTKPLEIKWLCSTCHGVRHQEINDLIYAGEDLTARGFL